MARIRPWQYLRKRPRQPIGLTMASVRAQLATPQPSRKPSRPQILEQEKPLEQEATSVEQEEKSLASAVDSQSSYEDNGQSSDLAQEEPRYSRLAQAKAAGEPHFRPGLKEVWLPDFTITFIQTPELHPKFAKFLVPLNFSKLDLRDFLWSGYRTRALNIRSWVYQRPVELQDNRGPRPVARWHRREALKYMIVEMDEPFVWPEKPKDMKPYDRKMFNEIREKTLAKDTKKGREKWKEGLEVLDSTRKRLREDAAAILSGEVKWRPTHTLYGKQRYM